MKNQQAQAKDTLEQALAEERQRGQVHTSISTNK